MLIKTKTDDINGKKWEISTNDYNNYSYKYYEFFSQCGWRLIAVEENYSKDAIEEELDIILE